MPSKTTSKKDHPEGAKKTLSFVCNECGRKDPYSLKVKPLGLLVFKRQSRMFYCLDNTGSQAQPL